MNSHHRFWPRRLPHAIVPPQTSLWDNLAISARRYPDKAALVFFGRTVSYRALEMAAQRMAAFLHRLGVRKGDRVLLCMQNCPQLVLAHFAILGNPAKPPAVFGTCQHAMASSQAMKQSSLDLNLSTKKTRKQELLAQMDRVVPWAALIDVIAPYYPEGKNGRPPFALETMLRIHCMQQWFTLSDLAMEEAFFDTPIYREFAGLDAHGRMPDESTILRFRHRLEKHRLAEQILATVNDLLAAQGLLLKAGTAVDATLIAAPSSTKNKDRKRDPEMHSSQKGNEWHFGMKAHIGVDADSGLVHTVIGTSGNVADVTRRQQLAPR
jgi:hypothetical protein